MSTIEEATQILKRDDGNGNVYDHISKIILKLIQENPSRLFSQFESASLSVKMSANTIPANVSKQLIDSSLAMVSILKAQGSSGEENDIQNLLLDSTLYEWAGLSFTKEDIFFIQNSMYKLVRENMEENPISKIRFWGKMLTCSGNDYTIFECVDKALSEISPNLEGRGGANKYAYYVLIDSKFSRLPNVEEVHLVCARRTRKYLTGKLDVEVSGYPLFPGKEAHYLRALIGLISSDTAVAPTSFFDLNEDEDIVSKMEATEDEEPQKPVPETVGTLEYWVHIQRCINSMGRMQIPKIEGEDGEIEDPRYDTATTERDNPLAPLSDEIQNWNSTVFANNGSHDIGILKSTRWPGAVAASVVGQIRFINCYVGYGIRAQGSSYTPPSLPPLQTEFEHKLNEMTDNIEQPSLEVDEDTME
jgi:radial spoke head protein 4/6